MLVSRKEYLRMIQRIRSQGTGDLFNCSFRAFFQKTNVQILGYSIQKQVCKRHANVYYPPRELVNKIRFKVNSMF
jgi:hypothetical protein